MSSWVFLGVSCYLPAELIVNHGSIFKSKCSTRSINTFNCKKECVSATSCLKIVFIMITKIENFSKSSNITKWSTVVDKIIFKTLHFITVFSRDPVSQCWQTKRTGSGYSNDQISKCWTPGFAARVSWLLIPHPQGSGLMEIKSSGSLLQSKNFCATRTTLWDPDYNNTLSHCKTIRR